MLMEPWRKKDQHSVEVLAIRLDESNVTEVAELCGAEVVEEINPEHPQETQKGLNIDTHSMGGVVRASLGMYVIKFGSLWFTQHNRPFEEVYEPVNRPSPPLESAGDARKAAGFADPFDRGRRF